MPKTLTPAMRAHLDAATRLAANWRINLNAPGKASSKLTFFSGSSPYS